MSKKDEKKKKNDGTDYMKTVDGKILALEPGVTDEVETIEREKLSKKARLTDDDLTVLRKKKMLQSIKMGKDD